MTGRASAPYVFGRVAARAGIGVWRHRGSVLLALLASATLGGYMTARCSGSSKTSEALDRRQPSGDN
jgi:hypothetical protein